MGDSSRDPELWLLGNFLRISLAIQDGRSTHPNRSGTDPADFGHLDHYFSYPDYEAKTLAISSLSNRPPTHNPRPICRERGKARGVPAEGPDGIGLLSSHQPASDPCRGGRLAVPDRGRSRRGSGGQAPARGWISLIGKGISADFATFHRAMHEGPFQPDMLICN